MRCVLEVHQSFTHRVGIEACHACHGQLYNLHTRSPPGPYLPITNTSNLSRELDIVDTQNKGHCLGRQLDGTCRNEQRLQHVLLENVGNESL